MIRKLLSIVLTAILLSILFTACNLPERQALPTRTPTSAISAIAENTPTPTSLCTNAYFPNHSGDTWEYSGSNSAMGAYTRTDTITVSGPESFTVATTLANVPYSVSYACSPGGLTVTDPIQQFVGAILSSPNAPLQVQLISNSGTSLPAKISPGDTWQQIAEGNASSQDFNLNGRFVFNYVAVGYEDVTVSSGTYHALRVDTTIRIEVSGFHILAGTYQITSWLVTDVGLVKSEGASHVTGVEFTDHLELTKFTPVP
ncbi:MAG: hypothetical protein WAV05_16500 [Anaerolineales bacterium]